MGQPSIPDSEWLALQFDAERARHEYSIPLPALPSDGVQVSFTGQSGEHNMQQAFEFYSYILSACTLGRIKDPKMLDFGGGWGRVARLFLRETPPENIYLAETRASAIKLLRDGNAPFSIIHNAPEPPMAGLPGDLDLAFAYSVFSHLSEEYFLKWVEYILTKLKSGGNLVFTSRGNYFIKHLLHLQDNYKDADPMLFENIRRLREMMPHPTEILRRFDAGEFQFYPIGGSEELVPSFFGEAFIPRSYIEKHFGNAFVSFNEDIPRVDQSITILRKK